jgi:hypothetical protein
MMRKTMLVLLMVLLTATAFANEGNFDSFTLGGNAGVWYNAAELPSGAAGFLAALFNIRAGVNGHFVFNINESVSVGPELGVMYMQGSYTIGNDVTEFILFDLPVRLSGIISLGPIVINPYAGVLFQGALFNTESTTELLTSVEVGSRVGFAIETEVEGGGKPATGPSFLFVEGSYVIGETSFPRFGAGLQIPVTSF